MTNRIVTGREFGLALCAHLGLDPKKVGSGLYMNIGADDVFSVSLDITLRANDMEGIAEQMRRIGQRQ